MIQPMQRREFMTNHVGCPILRDSGANQPIQGHGRRPHDVGPCCIVIRLSQHLGPLFNQRQQQAFGKSVLHLGIGRIGQVLLHDMDKRIDDAIGALRCRQSKTLARIQN